MQNVSLTRMYIHDHSNYGINGTSVNGLPNVARSLDWIRLVARFPVRIQVDDPDDSFRLGASAVATVRGVLRADGR